MCCSSSNSSIARSKLRTASEFAREDEGLGPNGLPLSGRSPCDSVAALSCFCPLRKKIPFWNHSFITTYKLPDCYLSWLSWLFQISKVAGSTAFHTVLHILYMSQAASHLQLSVRYLQGHLLSNLASRTFSAQSQKEGRSWERDCLLRNIIQSELPNRSPHHASGFPWPCWAQPRLLEGHYAQPFTIPTP